MAGAVDFANRTDIPLTMDADVSEVVTLETRFVIVRLVVGEWSVDWYAVNSSHSINFVTELGALEGQLDFRGEWGGGSRQKRLGVGGRGQFLDILFQIVSELRHLHLVEGGK